LKDPAGSRKILQEASKPLDERACSEFCVSAVH
jgi:hypothetical protein